jgi:hypothetical protein
MPQNKNLTQISLSERRVRKDKRFLASPDLSVEVKAELTKRFALYDPVELQREVHNAVDALLSLNKAVNLEGGKSLVISDLHAV